MFVDDELVLSDEQDLEQTAATYYSTNAIDLGVVRDVGKGRPMYVVIVVDEDFDSDGTSYITFHLIEEDTVTEEGVITLDSNSPILLSTEAFVHTALTAGRTPIIIPIPPGIALRYIGLAYEISVATTGGKVTAFVALEAQTNI